MAGDPWGSFQSVDDDEDEWSSFKSLATAPKQQPAPPRPNLPSLGLDSLTGAVDGDTARLASGRSLRLWGVDAPEKRQQGWNRQGQAVPIGERAKAALDGLLAGAQGKIGNPVSMSFNRPVAPVTLGNVDLGQKLARQGDVMAACAATNRMRTQRQSR